jgi:hypothetical protein
MVSYSMEWRMILRFALPFLRALTGARRSPYTAE